MRFHWCAAAGYCLLAALIPVGGRTAAAEGTAPPAKQMVAFLGVGVQPVPPAEGRDLGLPEGVGLTVRLVDESSPAQSRINVGDVLEKLDDQLLVHPYQLAVLVRTYAPGTEVRVSLRRGGNSMDVPVVLGQHEAGPLPPGGGALPMPFAPGRPAPGILQLTPGGGDGKVTVQVIGADGAAGAVGVGTGTIVTMTSSTDTRRSAMRVENGTTYALTTANGVTTYTVTAPDGAVLFTGPATTTAEQARVPDAHRAQLDALLSKAPAPGVAVPAPQPGAPGPAAP